MNSSTKRKVMILTHGLYPVPGYPVSGNGIRAWGIAKGLLHHGFEVIYSTPADTVHPHTLRSEVTLVPYTDRSDLHGKIALHQPDVLVVGYWAYMHLIPQDIDTPIVMDLLAPWLLETAFQEIYDMEVEAIDYLKCLNRADFFLCCTQRQKAFHTAWLLMSGFGNRKIPLEVVPISTDPNVPERPTASSDAKTVFLYGGVLWPWRSPGKWIEGLLDILVETGSGELQLVVGKYPLHESSSSYGPDLPQGDQYEGVLKQSDLLPYDEMERLYLTADVGIELSEWNLEREFSFSFRVIEYLRCGLPVICNDFLEVASLIQVYDAGWIVDSGDAESFARIVRQILAGKANLDSKRKNAARLVREQFNSLHTIAPLVDFCKHPVEYPRTRHLFLSLIKNDCDVHALQTRVTDLEGLLGQRDEMLGQRDKLLALQQSLVEQSQKEKADLIAIHDKNLSSWKEMLHWYRLAEERRLSMRLRRFPGKLLSAIKLVELLCRACKRRLMIHLQGKQGKQNLAVVTRGDIFPVDHGAAAKVYHTARVLSFDYNEVYLITQDQEKFYIFNDGEMQEEYYPRPIGGLLYPAEGVLRDRLNKMGMPDKESFLFFPMLDLNFRLRVLYVAIIKGISIYQAEFPAFMDACLWAHRFFGGIRAIVEHNIEFSRIATTYHLSDDVRERMKTYEVEQCQKVDYVVTVSRNDSKRLIEAGVDEGKIITIPHGVDLEQFECDGKCVGEKQKSIRKKYGISEDEIVLIFHGIYSYAPNGEAAQLIGSDILPALNKKGYNPKCLAVGKYPPEASNHADLIYTGVVPHVAPYIGSADIAIVPLQDGGGTRMKILEYFAAGIPVVATSKGTEGIEVEPGREIVIEDEMERFVEAIVDLIDHPEKSQAIGNAGRKFVEALDWRKIGESYVRLYDQPLRK